jgi:hypothetical protein
MSRLGEFLTPVALFPPFRMNMISRTLDKLIFFNASWERIGENFF